MRRYRELIQRSVSWALLLTLATALQAQTPTKSPERDLLYYGTAYTPTEEQSLQQAMRDLSLSDKREETLKQLKEAGFLQAEVPYGDTLVICLIPPSLLYADNTLILLNALLSLGQFPLQQKVRWNELPEEAQQAVLMLLETQMPYDEQQRQWVRSRLDEVEISLEYKVSFLDKDERPVAFYAPPAQRAVRVPVENRQWRAYGRRLTTASALRKTNRGVELLSEPVNLNRLEQLRKHVYEAAVAYVREENRKAYQELLDTYLKPCRVGMEELIGKQVDAVLLNEEWLTAKVREVNKNERLTVRDNLFFCLKRPAFPNEGARSVEECHFIDMAAIGRDRGARD